MILNGGQQLDTSSAQRAASLFSTKNGLSNKAKSELIFVCKSFVLFYNTCATRSEEYDILQVFDLFDANMQMQAIAGAEMGSIGLETDALYLYKVVPYIATLYNQEDRIKQLSKKEKENELLKRELKKQIERVKQAEIKAQELMDRDRRYGTSSSLYSSGSQIGRC